jgi:prepilin-type N-terminal cleavage/methylation domain-containing protein
MMRCAKAFTIIEMLVVILIIVILIAIVLAVGQQVRVSSQMALTRTELKNLQAALKWYQHKTGITPANMGDFLLGYQRMHAYQAGGIWRQHSDVLTKLPANLVVTGTFLAPGGTDKMTGIAEVLDAQGNPLQYVPPPISPPPPYHYKGFYPYGFPNATPINCGSSNFTVPPQLWVTVNTTPPLGYTPPPGSGYPPYPLQDSHTPYFFSFGSEYGTSGLTPGDYIYSYAP